MVKAVIMAGGRGERFWPLSREERPKQLLCLDGKKSLLQRTVERVLPLTGVDGIFIVTAAHLRDEVRHQIPQLPEDSILVEPEARNTAPCIALAAAHLRARSDNDDLVMAVLPADHAIFNDEGFRRTLQEACRLAREPAYQDSLMTIGIQPTRPETGYGYIHLGSLQEHDGISFYPVRRFVEKPHRERAEMYLRSGEYVWNSGMFVWRLRAIEQAFEKHLPAVAEGMDRIRQAIGTPDYRRILTEVYADMPAISIDYGVMEKAARIVCVPARFGWDDVGNWSAVGRLLPADKGGNVVHGKYVGIDTENCIIYNETNRLVATLGLRDVVIVDTGDAVLVCHKDSVQQVRDVVKALRGNEQYRGLLRTQRRQPYPATASAVTA